MSKAFKHRRVKLLGTEYMQVHSPFNGVSALMSDAEYTKYLATGATERDRRPNEVETFGATYDGALWSHHECVGLEDDLEGLTPWFDPDAPKEQAS